MMVGDDGDDDDGEYDHDSDGDDDDAGDALYPCEAVFIHGYASRVHSLGLRPPTVVPVPCISYDNDLFTPYKLFSRS